MFELLKDPYLQGLGIVVLLGILGLSIYDALDSFRDSAPMTGTFRPARTGSRRSSEAPGGPSRPSGAGARSAGRQGTPTLDAWIDPASGAMSARIHGGPFASRRIEDLSQAECRELLAYCRLIGDLAGGRFVETWLRRRYLDSSAETNSGFRERETHRPPPPEEGPLGRDEALATLGLGAGASEKDIVKAHRAMIKKHHPDHGGSTAKAARINQAKDFLLRG